MTAPPSISSQIQRTAGNTWRRALPHFAPAGVLSWRRSLPTDPLTAVVWKSFAIVLMGCSMSSAMNLRYRGELPTCTSLRAALNSTSRLPCSAAAEPLAQRYYWRAGVDSLRLSDALALRGTTRAGPSARGGRAAGGPSGRGHHRPRRAASHHHWWRCGPRAHRRFSSPD